MRGKKWNIPHHKEGGGEFTVTLGSVGGNIKEKLGERRLGYRERPALNPCSSAVTLLPRTEEDSSEPCPRYPLVDIEQWREPRPFKIPASSALKLGGYAHVASECPSE